MRSRFRVGILGTTDRLRNLARAAKQHEGERKKEEAEEKEEFEKKRSVQ